MITTPVSRASASSDSSSTTGSTSNDNLQTPQYNNFGRRTPNPNILLMPTQPQPLANELNTPQNNPNSPYDVAEELTNAEENNIAVAAKNKKKKSYPTITINDFLNLAPNQIYDGLFAPGFAIYANRFLKRLVDLRALPPECPVRLGKNKAEKDAQRKLFTDMKAEHHNNVKIAITAGKTVCFTTVFF